MPKILLVDDEPDILKILEAFLKKFDFEVIKASGGEEGVRMVRSEQNIDLMILDLVMPGFTGIDVLQTMKNLGIKTRYIILSGTMELQDFSEDLKNLGCPKKDIYMKPISLSQLLDAVKEKLSY